MKNNCGENIKLNLLIWVNEAEVIDFFFQFEVLKNVLFVRLAETWFKM